MKTVRKAHATASEHHSPRTRLVASLSALGLAAAFLTGCSSKNPDEGLCEDATKALESGGLKNAKELSNINDAGKLGQLGDGFVQASEKYSESEYSEPVGLMGKMLVTASKLDKDRNNQELQQELKSAAEQAAKPGVTEKADEFGDKCPAFSSSGS